MTNDRFSELMNEVFEDCEPRPGEAELIACLHADASAAEAKAAAKDEVIEVQRDMIDQQKGTIANLMELVNLMADRVAKAEGRPSC